MADDTNSGNGLPPKLDLRKKIITPLTARPAFTAPVPVADAAGGLASPSVPGPLSGGMAASGDTPRGTMRIMLPEVPEPSADRLDGIPTPSLSSEAAPAGDSVPGAPGPRPLMRPVMAPKTIKLKKPVPLGIKRDTPDPAAPLGTKRATSKISLPSDTDGPTGSTTSGSQPARIVQPVPIAIPAVPAVHLAEASGKAADTALAPAVPPPQPAPDPKRQTSRISLDSVLGNEGDTGPRTIKLKRPASNTIKVQGIESPDAGELRSKTAAIDLSTASPGDDTPETQKKTIKVKRPSARPSLRTAAAGGAGEATGGGSSPRMFVPPTRKLAADSAHWTFIVAGCAATIIAGVLIYVLCAQALGPNLSLTPLSYSGPDSTTELPWPERIYRTPGK